MENQIKVNLWIEDLLKKSNNSSLTNFNFLDKNNLRMTNYLYDEIFSLLTKGFPLKVGNLDLSDKTLMQALDEALNEDKQNNKIHIYTDCDYKKQEQKLSYLSKQETVFLTFGLLDYFDDNHMSIKSAPLVLLPLKIEKVADGYQMSSYNHEVYLNDALIDKLIETRRVDISYPLDPYFSLIEYFTYVSTKVRNYHFSVNNGCFITDKINIHSFYHYQDFKIHQKEIANLPLVKSISYLNSEFFNFNKSNYARLNNQYLSLLNLDNDEYKILRRINQRENVVIKTNLNENKYHLLTNIVYDFLLNNKKVLITYDDEASHIELLNFLKDNLLDKYFLDLSPLLTNKETIIKKLLTQNNLDYDTKLLDQTRIDETVDTYYLLKNNFKKFINALRKNNEPMNLSINRAINEYYILDKLPDMEIDIPNVDLIDEKKLSEYLSSINAFSTSLENLKCHYLDHPFYGFNNLTLNQKEYLELKEKITLLSNEFAPCKQAYQNLEQAFGLPFPQTLKGMKCILNIVSLIPELININQAYFTLENYDEIFEKLISHNQLFNKSLSIRNQIISLYGDKVFLIDHALLHKQIEQPLNRKTIHSYRQYFMKKVKIDESILKSVSLQLDEYYDLNKKIEEIIEQNTLFKDFYSEGIYQIEELEKQFTKVVSFKNYCEFLEKEHLSYSYKKLDVFNEEALKKLPLLRKKCQLAFNHILNYVKYLQNYFDSNLVDFTTLPLVTLEVKINKASKNFSSINDYLNFYLSQRKLNKILPSLGDELLKYSLINSYSAIFMKRFYHLYALSFMNNNPLFKNYTDETFFNSLENYQDYNKDRLEILNALIKNNIRSSIQNNLLALRSLELPYLHSLDTQELSVLPLERLLGQTKNIILNSFPLILMPIKEVSSLLYKNDYRFDCNIVWANENLLSLDIIPSEVRSDQLIVFDSRLINNTNDNLINQNNENFMYSALQTLNVINYISSSYKENILKANSLDLPLKEHLIKKLKNRDLLVSKDVSTPYGVIDILVKIPQAKKPVAIIIDHLNYYSIEASIDSFYKANESLNKLGFASYRLISSTYFHQEDKEFEKLINFILEHSKKDKVNKKVNKTHPLVEVIYPEYLSLEDAYYHIQNKETKSKMEIILELLKMCAPCHKEQFMTFIGRDGLVALTSLQVEGKIKVNNNFIFLNNQTIEFKRVKKDSKVIRQLDYVSNEEIAQGVLKLINNRDFPLDETIKLILQNLGYQKMNQQQYFKIQNIINDLLDEKKLSINEGILHFEKH